MPELFNYLDRDGVDIHYRVWNVDDPHGSVLIVHGAAEHSGRYERFASILNTAGYSVVAPDLRGHGKTAASSGPGVAGPGGFEGLLRDVDDMVRIADESANDRPLILFGHSMGSVIALRYAETRPDSISALVLSGPVGVLPGLDERIAQLRSAVEAGQQDEQIHALSAFNAPFEPARTEFDWLSRDPAEVDAYVADPLCGRDIPTTYGSLLAIWEATRDGTTSVECLAKGLPVLIIAGEQDVVSDFTVQAKRFGERLRKLGVPLTERYYPGARHELLNETNRDEVHGDVLRWMQALVQP